MLRRRLADAPLTPPTRRHALALLALLAEAEAQVHGIAVDDVHFHELADWDSLLDVVAAGCIAAQLEGARWTASALPLGGGTVRTAHGLLPVPAPATSRAADRLSVARRRHRRRARHADRRRDPAPSGPGRRAAARAATTGGSLAVGSGAGTRALPGMPNILRALVFAHGVATPPPTP